MPKQSLTPEGPDPIDSADPIDLRVEILKLRDLVLGLTSHAEVLADRVVELETQNDQLHAVTEARSRKLEQTINEHEQTINELAIANQALHVELGRSPIIRIARAVARRLKLR